MFNSLWNPGPTTDTNTIRIRIRGYGGMAVFVSYLYLWPSQAQIISVSVVSVPPTVHPIFVYLLHKWAFKSAKKGKKTSKNRKKGQNFLKIFHPCQILFVSVYLWQWPLARKHASVYVGICQWQYLPCICICK